MRFFSYILILPVLCISFALRAQQFQKPHELIDENEIQNLEQRFVNETQNEDLIQLQSDVEGLIAKYTEQFASEKRIRDDIDLQGSLTDRANVNTIRLFSLAKSQTAQAAYYLGESPYLLRLHVLLGKVHAKLGRAEHALQQYSMALRYRSIETMPQLDTIEQKEAYYTSMIEVFTQKDRVSQSRPDQSNESAAAEQFRRLYEQYWPLKRELAELKRHRSVRQAARARGQNLPDRSAELEQTQTRFDSLIEEMERIRNGPYRAFHDRRKKETSELIYQCALIVKQLEEKNRRKELAKNRNSKQKGTPLHPDARRTEVRSYPGFRKLLEWSIRVDTENLNALADLAEQYRTSRQYRPAIDTYLDLINLANQSNRPQNEIIKYQYNLSGLYTDTGQFLKAMEAYEQIVQTNEADRSLIENPAVELYNRSETAIKKHLADLQFNKGGNFNRAEELYSDVLQQMIPVNESDDQRIRVERLSVRYQILYNLAAIARRNRRSNEERTYLADAKDACNALKEQLTDTKNEIDELKARLTEIKNNLRQNDDRNLARTYYQILNRDLPQKEKIYDFQMTRLDAMNLPDLLEREAILSIRGRDFQTAIDHYREIAKTGKGSQVQRARDNIKLIRLSLEDGRMRQPALPANYER